MAEQVQTGGVMSFAYKKGYHPKATQEEKDEIEAAYEAAYERKKREKKKKLMLWILLALLAIIILTGLIWWMNR